MSGTDPDGRRWQQLIRDLRAARSWSQQELGEELGTDQATISRWERGLVLPGFDARQQLERLAQEQGLQSLFGVETLVNSSPFPMLLANREMLVIAASRSSGFSAGKSCLEQTPLDERQHLLDFTDALERGGFWTLTASAAIDYAFTRGATIGGAVVVPIVVRGEVFALVQRRDAPPPS